MPTNIAIPALAGKGAIPAYRAAPEGTPRAAIIVIPEIFGVNPGIATKVEDWAAQGYLAFAPDLFWRFAPGVELDPDVETELHQAFANMGQFSADDGVEDIEALIKFIRREEGVDKVGAVGFCLGGRLAYMVATRTDADASVGYYGVMIDQMLGEAHAIAQPLMLHIPTADHFVGPDAQAAIHGTFDNHPRVTLHDYPGLDHGFAAASGNRRDEDGAQLADSRTREFFAEHLG
ncbi:MAG: dienelactone hydrolase family protein [Candidatus Andeanibacterium colombiense]|uniref:Dienelactone hydrolase family protein n=1 Tax=Candidatus Andeanibacterium colombiense TaxID=3121345 RepID=A0AAJ5X2W6_9SPHN|nr:MAG: dienelactone hydrolase family protein [Sphingomonadaceae bacterium]